MTTTFHMEIDDYERVTETLRGLAHPSRLKIVQLLLMKKTLNVSELQRYLAMPQSTVSQHLSKLKLLKIVSCERKGLEIFYRVDDEKVKQTMEILMF